MSYSFSAKGASKVEALAKVAASLENVIAQQPVHAADRDLALDAAKDTVELLAEDSSREVNVSVCGSIWKNAAGVQQVSISVNAQLQAKS